ncbi:hypothetical protein JCM6882_006110 [Rhodosporidiobolus microsporus]
MPPFKTPISAGPATGELERLFPTSTHADHAELHRELRTRGLAGVVDTFVSHVMYTLYKDSHAHGPIGGIVQHYSAESPFLLVTRRPQNLSDPIDVVVPAVLLPISLASNGLPAVDFASRTTVAAPALIGVLNGGMAVATQGLRLFQQGRFSGSQPPQAKHIDSTVVPSLVPPYASHVSWAHESDSPETTTWRLVVAWRDGQRHFLRVHFSKEVALVQEPLKRHRGVEVQARSMGKGVRVLKRRRY